MKKFSFILALIFSLPVYAQEVELSPAAVKNYGIETSVFEGQTVALPRSALVASRDEYFVYMKDDKHFQELEVHPLEITADFVSIAFETDEEREFVITGAPYLRIVFLSNANPATGHSH